MMDVVFDTIIDSVKLLPFLFLTYLAMEYLEGIVKVTYINVTEGEEDDVL